MTARLNSRAVQFENFARVIYFLYSALSLSLSRFFFRLWIDIPSWWDFLSTFGFVSLIG